MLITIAICTRNRARLLRGTLDQLTRLRIPDGCQWELVIVDNNSTDSTAGVIKDFEHLLPLRYLTETRLGLSHARNAAVAAARGTHIIFTDDDVLVDPTWLAVYCDGFIRRPEAAIFGGAISPWFEGDPPSWLDSVYTAVDVAFATRDPKDLGDSAVSEANLPFGANMAFRLDVLRTHQFDPSLGRAGTEMVGGEETRLIRALLSQGYSGWWLPSARVRHFIPRERQTIRYLRNWYAGYGRMIVRLDARSVADVERPRWIWRELVVSEVLFFIRRILLRPVDWIEDLKRAATARGKFREFGQLQRRGVYN